MTQAQVDEIVGAIQEADQGFKLLDINQTLEQKLDEVIALLRLIAAQTK
jgi:hypothetical protein